MKLFRQESVTHSTRRLQGEVLIGGAPSLTACAAGLVAVICCAAVFAANASYARKETAQGWLVPQGGIIRGTAPESGVLLSLSAAEGDLVAKGAPLVRVRRSLGTGEGDSGERMVVLANDELDANRSAHEASLASISVDVAGLYERRRILQLERAEAAEQVRLQQDREALAARALERAEVLRSEGYLSSRDFDAVSSSLLDTRRDKSAAVSALLAVDRELLSVANLVAAAPLRQEETLQRARSSQAALDQRRAQIETAGDYVVRSPIDGRILALPPNVGQSVAQGSTLFVVVPKDGSLEAEIYVPSRAAGFIRNGQEVAIQFQAFPYQKFGSAKGRVRSLSRTILMPPEVQVAGLAVQEPVIRVRVRLERAYMRAYGSNVALQPGQLLGATIILDRRSLLEWLLDPLYAVGRRG